MTRVRILYKRQAHLNRSLPFRRGRICSLYFLKQRFAKVQERESLSFPRKKSSFCPQRNAEVTPARLAYGNQPLFCYYATMSSYCMLVEPLILAGIAVTGAMPPSIAAEMRYIFDQPGDRDSLPPSGTWTNLAIFRIHCYLSRLALHACSREANGGANVLLSLGHRLFTGPNAPQARQLCIWC